MKFIEPDYIREWSPKFIKQGYYESWEGLNEICEIIWQEISPDLGKRKDVLEKTEQALWAFIGTLHDCYLEGRPMGFFLRTTAYSASKRYNPPWYNQRTLKRVYDLLLKYGFIEPRVGYPGYATKVYMSDRLRFLIEGNPISFTCNMHELVHLRDHNKALVEYIDTDYTTGKRQFLQGYIEYMDAYTIMFDGRRLSTSLFSVHSRGDFDLHGRYYNPANGAQGLSEKERSRILFFHPRWNEAQSVKEWDFKAMHPRLIYALIRATPVMDADGDYYMPVVKRLKCSDVIRCMVKLLMLTAVNAKSDESAIKAFRKKVNRAMNSSKPKSIKLREGWEVMQSEGITAEVLLKAIKETHSAIADWFCSDCGIKLMHHDSEIMRKILVRCMSEDIPALPIHDSVVVPALMFERVGVIAEECFDQYIDRCF